MFYLNLESFLQRFCKSKDLDCRQYYLQQPIEEKEQKALCFLKDNDKRSQRS